MDRNYSVKATNTVGGDHATANFTAKTSDEKKHKVLHTIVTLLQPVHKRQTPKTIDQAKLTKNMNMPLLKMNVCESPHDDTLSKASKLQQPKSLTKNQSTPQTVTQVRIDISKSATLKSNDWCKGDVVTKQKDCKEDTDIMTDDDQQSLLHQSALTVKRSVRKNTDGDRHNQKIITARPQNQRNNVCDKAERKDGDDYSGEYLNTSVTSHAVKNHAFYSSRSIEKYVTSPQSPQSNQLQQRSRNAATKRSGPKSSANLQCQSVASKTQDWQKKNQISNINDFQRPLGLLERKKTVVYCAKKNSMIEIRPPQDKKMVRQVSKRSQQAEFQDSSNAKSLQKTIRNCRSQIAHSSERKIQGCQLSDLQVTTQAKTTPIQKSQMLKSRNNSKGQLKKCTSSFASKKLSTKSAVSLSKSVSPPFTVAPDADQYSLTQVIGIQRPKPLNDYLTVPILKNYTRQLCATKKSRILINETQEAPRVRNQQIQDEYSQDNFSFDVDHIGDEAEARIKESEHTLRQFNTKQWYENLDKSEVVFQVGNSTSRGVFESASSKHKRLISETLNYSAMGTIKVRPIHNMALQTSAMPTNETNKHQLIFSGQQPSESIFEHATNSVDYASTTQKQDRRFPETSAFTDSILVDQRDNQDVGLRGDQIAPGKLDQALDLTELDDFTITQDADFTYAQDELTGHRGVAMMNQSKQPKSIGQKSQQSSLLQQLISPLCACCQINQVSCTRNNRSSIDEAQAIMTIVNTVSSVNTIAAPFNHRQPPLLAHQNYFTENVRESSMILSKVNFQQVAPKEISNVSEYEKEAVFQPQTSSNRLTPLGLFYPGQQSIPYNRSSDIMCQKPTPQIMQHKQANPQHLLNKHRFQHQHNSMPIVRSNNASVQRDLQSSNQSSICKFAPRHTDEDSSPYKGRYQHCQTNEEFVSDELRQQAVATLCDLGESQDHSVIDHWTDLNVKAGPGSSLDNPQLSLISAEQNQRLDDDYSQQLAEIIEGTNEETNTLFTEENNTANSQSTSAIHQLQFNQTIQSLLYLNQLPDNLMDQAAHRLRYVDLPCPKQPWQRKTLIFDLDETLAHCLDTEDGHTPDFTNAFSKDPQHIVQIVCQSGDGGEEIIEAGINLRPHVRECLAQCATQYQVGVFTASHKEYADAVIDLIDPTGTLIDFRLYRQHCFETNEGIFIKDLRVIKNRDLKDVILVDNSVYSFGFQLDNGVPIIPFFNDPSDQELIYLAQYVLSLSHAEDVRDQNAATFQLQEFKQASLSCYQQQPTQETINSNSGRTTSNSVLSSNKDQQQTATEHQNVDLSSDSVTSHSSTLRFDNEREGIKTKYQGPTTQSFADRRNETIAEVSYEGGDSETPVSQSMRLSQLSNSQLLCLSRQSVSALAQLQVQQQLTSRDQKKSLILSQTQISRTSNQEEIAQMVSKGKQLQPGVLEQPNLSYAGKESDTKQASLLLDSHHDSSTGLHLNRQITIQRSAIDETDNSLSLSLAPQSRADNAALLYAHCNCTLQTFQKQKESITVLRLQEDEDCDAEDIAEGRSFGSADSDDRTVNHSYMSEVDETEILAAKKRLDFYDNDCDENGVQQLRNPVSAYALGRAKKQGQKLRKQVYGFTGESCSSSDLTQSLMLMVAPPNATKLT